MRNGIIEIFNEFQCSFKAKIKNRKGCLAMDGWTNPSTGEKHICILLQPLAPKTEIFFVKSTVVNGTLTADALYDFLKLTIESLEEHEFTVIGIVGDNARAQQSAINKLSLAYPHIAQLRCAAHLMNLIFKKILKEACKDALTIVQNYVSVGKIKRYVETRWNSVYDRLQELEKREIVAGEELECVQSALVLLNPVIGLLNYAQSNNSNWVDFLEKVNRVKSDISLPAIVVSSMVAYEKCTVNCVTEIVNCVEDKVPEISPISQKWLENLSKERLEELDHLIMMRSISSQTEENVTGQLRKFVDKIVKKIMLSEAEVERVFSRHKSIHTKLRAQLSPEIVEKMLFVRYNAKKLGDHAFSQFSQAGPDEWYFEELEPDEPI